MIPTAKATRQVLCQGIEDYLHRHGEYPVNYPNGPADVPVVEGDADVTQIAQTPSSSNKRGRECTTVTLDPPERPPKRALTSPSQTLIDQAFREEQEHLQRMRELEFRKMQIEVQQLESAQAQARAQGAQGHFPQATREDEDAELTGEDRAQVRDALSTFISVPEKIMLQIFTHKFDPLNLTKLHGTGAVLEDKPNQVELSSGRLTIKKSSSSHKDFGTSPQIWQTGFIVYMEIMSFFFSRSHHKLPGALIGFYRKIMELARIYRWADAVLPLAIRHHTLVLNTGPLDHSAWPMPQDRIYEFCVFDKLRPIAQAQIGFRGAALTSTARKSTDPNDSSVVCLHFQKYGRCDASWCKRKHESVSTPDNKERGR